MNPMSNDKKYIIRLLLDMRYPPTLPAIDAHHGLVDKLSYRHPLLRDARQRLEGYYSRIEDGVDLTENDIRWINWLCYVAATFVRTGELPGMWVTKNGVTGYELDGQFILAGTAI